MTQEEKLALIKQAGITVCGDLVLEKHVEHEIGNVEAGGIGIQIVNGNVDAPASKAANAPKQKRPSAKNSSQKAETKRELMTFKRNNITDEHLKVLFHQLVTAGWMEGQQPDFLALFSGTSDGCTLVWKGLYGKGTLRGFFRKMVEANVIMVPEGYTLDHILEGHYIDANGQFLQGLNSSGEEPALKANEFIRQSIALLKTDIFNMDRDALVGMMGAHVVNDENRSRRR